MIAKIENYGVLQKPLFVEISDELSHLFVCQSMSVLKMIIRITKGFGVWVIGKNLDFFQLLV